MLENLKLKNISNIKKALTLLFIFEISIIALGIISWNTKKLDSTELEKSHLNSLTEVAWSMADKLNAETDSSESIQQAIKTLKKNLGKIKHKDGITNMFFILDGYKRNLADLANTKAGKGTILEQVDAKYQPMIKDALNAMQAGKLADILVPIGAKDGNKVLLYGRYYKAWNSVLVSAISLDLVQEKLKSTLLKTIVLIIFVTILVFLFSIPMIKSLTKGPEYIDTILRRISKGDLSVKSELNQKDESGKISDSLNLLVLNFRDILIELKEASNLLGNKANQMSSVSFEVGENLKQQALESEQASTAMNEISYSINEIAQNAATASEKLDSTHIEIAAINSAVHTSNLEIVQLAKEINSASIFINKLSHETEQIGNVLSEINGISEQTNLLALNAAIEAARAGDAGRGFAVVADEVRALAVRTSESTAQISEMNAKLNDGTNQAVKAMNLALQKSQESSKSFDKIKQTVENIEAVMQDVEQNAVQVSVATQEQSRTVEETSKAIAEIASASEGMESSSLLIKNASQELQSLVKNLETKLANFKF